ncbi:hypothetical protein M885DRAFT_401454, partial [Pelagophyceae sp. CCMP2097]
NQAMHAGASQKVFAAQEALIAARNDLDLAADEGATPLFMATQEGHSGAVQALIDAGADLNLAVEDGPGATQLL